MERLTRRNKEGKACWKTRDPDCGSCEYCPDSVGCLMRLSNRLADYEDTGLTPEEIDKAISIKNWEAYKEQRDREAEELLEYKQLIDLDHLRELVEAERSGRLVEIKPEYTGCMEGALNFQPTEFFIESTYVSEQNKTLEEPFEEIVDRITSARKRG